MPKTLIILPLLLVTSPAFAQEAPPAVQLPRELTDPAAQMRLAARLQSISSALLNVRVGNIAAAIEGREPTSAERNVTVGDLVRRRDPNFDRDVAQEVATVGPKIQHSMQTVARALPRVMRDVADAQRSIDRAVANLPDPSYPRR
ncbi:MAG TPA: hypothetical protein VGU01_10120 [Sphingomicrobium sp.]|nr:hypothetical protein [Sphingomicrobium sp.]